MLESALLVIAAYVLGSLLVCAIVVAWVLRARERVAAERRRERLRDAARRFGAL